MFVLSEWYTVIILLVVVSWPYIGVPVGNNHNNIRVEMAVKILLKKIIRGCRSSEI
jgi:hypothetical protein